MNHRKRRNRDTEEYVANKQARYLGKDAKEVLDMIDAKGGDYYRVDLYPAQNVVQAAEDEFNSYRTGTPAMEIIADDMRVYYGLKQPRVMTNLPDDLQSMVDNISAPFKEKAAVVIPVASQAAKEAVDQAVNVAKGGRGGLRKAMEAVAIADNAVQSAIRQKILGLQDNVVPEKENVRTLLGQTVFRPNRMAPDSYYKASTPGVAEDIATLLAARALQAGAVAGTLGTGMAAASGARSLAEQLGLIEEIEKDQGVSPGLMVRY